MDAITNMLNSISNLLPAIVWSLTSGIILTMGDIVLRSWFQTRWQHGFEIAFLIYSLGMFFMLMSFFQQNIAVATVAAVAINAIGYILLAYMIYGDVISHGQIVGIILGLAALAILELS